MDNTELIKAIEEKYKSLGENPETYLKGLLQAKPITYWDYIQVDTLLSLQKTRTDFKDEEIFVMYHQVTELTLKMMTATCFFLRILHGAFWTRDMLVGFFREGIFGKRGV